MKEAAALEWLTWFWQRADFGPADADIRIMMEEKFEAETRTAVPSDLSWREGDGGE